MLEDLTELGAVDGGNPAYIAALQNLDGDMPQYIRDNTDDELSHAAFLNACLISKGEEPVDGDLPIDILIPYKPSDGVFSDYKSDLGGGMNCNDGRDNSTFAMSV